MSQLQFPLRHPVTGRFMAGDCERDCLEFCAGMCGAAFAEPEPEPEWIIDVETGEFL